jgi:sulfatase modifying factor 1
LPVPPQVEAVVMKALTKDRDQRYGSALEFAREFTRAASVPAASEAFPTTKAVGFPDKAQAEVVRQAKVKAESERLAHAKVGRERLVLEEPKTKRGGPERSQVTPQHPTRAKYVALSLVGLAVIIAAIWYFSPSGSKQKTQGPTTAKSTEEEPESAIPQPALAAVAARVNPKDGLKYVWIPPGTFMMGCSPADMQCKKEEKPSHQVTITKGFWMGQTPVTVGAYKRFTGATGRQMPPEPEDLNFLNQTEVRFKFNPGWSNEAMPIVELWWDDAQAYCRWAGGRLPTEAEWEYAGRGGSTEARYGNIDDIAWYGGNSGRERPDSTGTSKEDYTAQWLGTLIPMHEVAKKRANGFGLYDMLGNGNEWVNDWYDENYYQNSPLQDPAGPSSGYFRVLRGGDRRTPAWLVRVSTRWHDSQTTHYMSGGGFRCGREVINP